MVASYRHHYGLPAMAVVVTRGDQVAEWAAVGKRRIDRDDEVTLQDRWHIGSLTKALTATLAGVLVDDGMISWETTIIDVWPEWKGSIHSGYEDVALRELASHTSGMSNEIFALPSIGRVWDAAPGTVLEKRQLWARELLGLAPGVPRGSFNYSNGGYIVIGAMLEAVTGVSWEQLMMTHLYSPLGMITAGFGAPDGADPWGHRLAEGKLEPLPPGPGSDNAIALGPAGTAHASLSDYAAFMVENLGGARGVDGIVSAATLKLLQTPVTSGYAMGWGIGYLNSSKLLGHTGSNGSWLTLVWVVPDHDIGILIAINSAHQNSHDAIDALQDKLLQRATGLRW
jgi:CubicO group peptidase (beta-lactamase class C family)